MPQENAAALGTDTAASVFVQGFPAPFDGSVTRTAQSLDPGARTLFVEVQVANPQRRLVPGMYAQVRFASPRQGTPLLVPGEAVIARADGLSVATIEDLRPEDRRRLPSREAMRKAADARRQDDAKSGGDAASKGGGKGGEKGGENGGSGNGGDKPGEKGAPNDAEKGDADDTDPDHARRIHLQQVEVGRDYGTQIEITAGLKAGQTIVANPGDDVVEGALVMPRARKGAFRWRQARREREGRRRRGRPRQAGPDAPPQGNQSPSIEAPTKGRK